ncbi:hypothetical protein [Moorena sp. SIO3F7]|nr:hypothetical protein [Moorena sp. SIO3F7]
MAAISFVEQTSCRSLPLKFYPTPDSRLPTPDSRFPILNSQFLILNSPL